MEYSERELFYEDETKIGIRRYNYKYKIWIECYIPKNKNDYSELQRIVTSILSK
jgi:hypothetical protein